MQFNAALALIGERAARLAHSLARLTEAHRHTPMMGRTFLQQAVPISFGTKTAVWLDGVSIVNAAVQRDAPLALFAGRRG